VRFFTWLKDILKGLLVSIVVLLLVEALGRVVKTVNQDIAYKKVLASEEWFVYSPTLGWERKPGYRGVVEGLTDRDFDGAGYFAIDSKQITDTTKKKIIFIGDSSTFGYGVPTQSSFVEVVEELLTDVNTINLGVNGYSSYQGRVSLDKYLPLLKPDLVVASFNFNDRRYVLPPDTIDSAETFEKVYRFSVSAGPRVAEFLEISYFFRALRRAMTAIGLLSRPVRDVRVDALKPRVDEDAYRRNLSHIAEKTKRLGIPLIFLLLKDNPIESHYLKEGIEKLKRSDKMAIEDLIVAVGGYMFSDLARIYLAKAYQAQGITEKAAEVVISRSPFRSLHGGHPVRLDTVYNDIMRQVASDYAVELVDGAKVLDEHPYVYIDFCHFNVEGHRRVGELLASRISQILSGWKQIHHSNSFRGGGHCVAPGVAALPNCRIPPSSFPSSSPAWAAWCQSLPPGRESPTSAAARARRCSKWQRHTRSRTSTATTARHSPLASRRRTLPSRDLGMSPFIARRQTASRATRPLISS
jgi:lysophospholipase L1-like esterase